MVHPLAMQAMNRLLADRRLLVVILARLLCNLSSNSSSNIIRLRQAKLLLLVQLKNAKDDLL